MKELKHVGNRTVATDCQYDAFFCNRNGYGFTIIISQVTEVYQDDFSWVLLCREFTDELLNIWDASKQ